MGPTSRDRKSGTEEKYPQTLVSRASGGVRPCSDGRLGRERAGDRRSVAESQLLHEDSGVCLFTLSEMGSLGRCKAGSMPSVWWPRVSQDEISAALKLPGVMDVKTAFPAKGDLFGDGFGFMFSLLTLRTRHLPAVNASIGISRTSGTYLSGAFLIFPAIHSSLQMKFLILKD